jgi:hypothetical protein
MTSPSDRPILRYGVMCRGTELTFVYRGALYRPGQDNSRTYGGAVVINKVRP